MLLPAQWPISTEEKGSNTAHAYDRNRDKTLRCKGQLPQHYELCPLSEEAPTLRRFTCQYDKRCMLVFMKLASDFSRGCVHAKHCNRQFPRPTPTPPHKDRSPGNGTPAGSRSRAVLPWTALQLRVEVNHHPRSARPPLASYPITTLKVVITPLEASQAGRSS